MLARGTVVAVRKASVSLSGRCILKDIDFALEAGELCGLIGANGSGKTTLLRTILGFVTPSSGSVTIEGSGRAAVGYVPQKFMIDPYMPLRARDLVALGLDGNRLGVPLPSKARRRKVDEMLEALDAVKFADQRISTLSGGQQQRILIAHAMIRRPRLLLLDEPLANLDLGSVSATVALLHHVSREFKTAVLLSAHDMNPLLPVMDRIVYLAHGRAVAGTTEAVVCSEVLSQLYGYHIEVVRVHGRVLVVAAGPEARALLPIERNPTHLAAIS